MIVGKKKVRIVHAAGKGLDVRLLNGAQPSRTLTICNCLTFQRCPNVWLTPYEQVLNAYSIADTRRMTPRITLVHCI